jgi:hypothetical protein
VVAVRPDPVQALRPARTASRKAVSSPMVARSVGTGGVPVNGLGGVLVV